MTKETLGWNEFFAASFHTTARPGNIAARVALEHKNLYVLYSEQGEIDGELTGRMLHQARSRTDLPAVGDWVVASLRENEQRAMIHAVLPRRSKFSRNAAGERAEEQIVAANVDTLFLVTGLDGNFNPARIERYLVLAWDSGARPVIILNKADQCHNVETRQATVEAVAMGVPVITISATEGQGIEELQRFLGPAQTVALMGSSGVGKSTIVNRLAGREVQAVGEVSESVGKGKHTTTHRELLVLPSGAILIDTPGMREIQLWDGTEGFADTFGDIETLAEGCRFRDCSHADEPGCAVREAIDNGILDSERFRRYRKLQRELEYQHRRQDRSAMLAERERWKKLTKEYRTRPHR